MDKEEFKNLFNELAQENGFERAYGMWFKEQDESLVCIDLQRSNYSHLYYVNINVYIQGLFGKNFKKSKDLKFGAGGSAIHTGPPNKYAPALDQENELTDLERKKMLEEMFSEYLIPFIKKISTRDGIKKSYKDGSYLLLPAVRQELDIPLES
jgi:hypothetical protein